MPEINMNEKELNDHVNNNPMTNRRPMTECGHTVPYGPATGREDPRAHDPKPSDGKEQWQGGNEPHPKGGLAGDAGNGPGAK
ncbi:MAG: hypothetical protein LIP16_11245 [Clostridium sp.]|nr:hypothetical protein [Clostridium sp.]